MSTLSQVHYTHHGMYNTGVSAVFPNTQCPGSVYKMWGGGPHFFQKVRGHCFFRYPPEIPRSRYSLEHPRKACGITGHSWLRTKVAPTIVHYVSAPTPERLATRDYTSLPRVAYRLFRECAARNSRIKTFL